MLWTLGAPSLNLTLPLHFAIIFYAHSRIPSLPFRVTVNIFSVEISRFFFLNLDTLMLMVDILVSELKDSLFLQSMRRRRRAEIY